MSIPDEVADRWAELSLARRQEISNVILGHPNGTVSDLYRHCRGEARPMRVLCDQLGISTSEDRLAEATFQQAADTRAQVRLSWVAIFIALVALGVSLFK